MCYEMQIMSKNKNKLAVHKTPMEGTVEAQLRHELEQERNARRQLEEELRALRASTSAAADKRGTRTHPIYFSF
jgi:hypothetical protein